MASTFPKTPQSFTQVQLSPLRRKTQSELKAIAPGHAFCVTVTCDAEALHQFTRRCRAVRCRPPSALAYLARCLGKTLASRTELLASQSGSTIYIPSRVDAIIAVEVQADGGTPTVRGLRFEDLANRTLDEIAEDMKTRMRQAKRMSVSDAPTSSRFAPKNAPVWWHHFVQSLRERTPASKKRRAHQMACVQLSSTAQWMDGRAGWGIRLYRPSAPSVMLVGQSRRPVAVGDEIAVRFCLDLAITFDHALVDGAPATRFIAALCKEIESGQALEEFPIRERERRVNTSS
jgi:pyruvate/2-oxoglutarate dehydrogenase complex dihydrolipoamide acyltransferase (E2) component